MSNTVLIGDPHAADPPLQITKFERDAAIGLSTAAAVLIYLADGDPAGFAGPVFWGLLFGATDRLQARKDAEDEEIINLRAAEEPQQEKE